MIRNLLKSLFEVPIALPFPASNVATEKFQKEISVMVIKDKLLVSKASNSYFKGLDFCSNTLQLLTGQ